MNHDQGKPTQTIYTCPMHPQIERDHPGACPICGMALESKFMTAGAGEGQDSELGGMKRRFWVGALLTLPVFLLAMAHLAPALAHAGNTPLSRWVQFLLSTPVVWWA